MTKSSQRKDRVMGRSGGMSTDEKCEECDGKMVKTGAYSYICTICGLVQTRKRKSRSKKF